MSERVSSTRRIIILVISCVVLVAGFAGVWWLIDPGPAELLRRGLTSSPRDPAEGEKWLHSAMARAGGRFPDAEIALARLLVRRRALPEASALLINLDKSACRSDLLLACARDMLQYDAHRTDAFAALEILAQRGGPDGIEALELLVSKYQEWGMQDELVTAETRLTQLEPVNPQRWAMLIDTLKAMTRESDCLTAIQQAQRHDLPDEFRHELQHRLVQQLVIQGDAATARKALEEMRQMEGKSVRVQGHEVMLLRLEGRPEQALKLLTSLAPQVPDRMFLYFTRGVLYQDLQRFPEAIQDLKRVVAAQPYHSQAQFKLSEAYRSSGQDELARQHQQLAAGILEKRKRINVLLRQRQDEPLNPQLYQELARLHYELGERGAAEKWKRWLMKQPLPVVE